MKKQFFLPISLFFTSLFIPLHAILPEYQKQLEASIPIVAITSLAIDVFSYLSADARYTLYGNNQLSKESEKIVRGMIKSFNLKQPLTIRQARSMWPIIAGNIFSNHDSLFVSKDTCSQIEAGMPLTKDLQHRLATSALMINNNYDAKLLLVCIATPAAIWTCSFLLNKLIKDHNFLESNNALLKNIALKLKLCEKSLTCKRFISLLIIAAFIAYQRSIISSQASQLIKNL